MHVTVPDGCFLEPAAGDANKVFKENLANIDENLL